MMWFLQADSIPLSIFALSHRPVPPDVAGTLLRRSAELYVAGEGREVTLVLGVLPPTFLGNTGWLWMIRKGDWAPTVPQLRVMRRVLRQLISMWGWNMHVQTTTDADTRFAKFLGFTPEREERGVITHRWAG